MTSLPILFEEEDVQSELQSMELDRETLIECVRYADNERALCTAHDPNGFDLVLMNAKVARALRDAFVGDRWEVDETANQPGIRNPYLKIRVIPCNFDENAGNRLADPTNLREKGKASKSKAACNKTSWLPGMEPEEVQQEDPYQTFVLGTHVDDDGVLRGELSKPLDFASGQYTRFKPRIILLDGSEPIDARPVDLPQSDAPTEVINIDVKRR
jgi:hypothetical protein